MRGGLISIVTRAVDDEFLEGPNYEFRQNGADAQCYPSPHTLVLSYYEELSVYQWQQD